MISGQGSRCPKGVKGIDPLPACIYNKPYDNALKRASSKKESIITIPSLKNAALPGACNLLETRDVWLLLFPCGWAKGKVY